MSVDDAAALARVLADAPDWNPRIEFAMHGEPSLHPSLVEVLGAFRTALPRSYMMLTSNGGGFVRDPAGLVPAVLTHLNVLALDWYESVTLVPKVLEGVRHTGITPRHYPADPLANPHRRRRPTEHDLVVVQDISRATVGTHSSLNNHCGAGAPPSTAAHGRRCAKPFRELSVRWNCEVAVCCNDWRGEYRCGNVIRDGLEAVWNGPAMRAARRYLLLGRREFDPCRRCDALSYRPGLLPDHKGLSTLPAPTADDDDAVAAALAAGPLTTPVYRQWELTTDRRLPLPTAIG